MHCHGWRSVYCMPKRPAFKGSAPINLSDRLHQVLRWALGSVEIFLSRHCPIWYGYGCGLKWLEHFSYINSVFYPWTSISLIAYCSLPAFCLLTGKFIIPEVCVSALVKMTSILVNTDHLEHFSDCLMFILNGKIVIDVEFLSSHSFVGFMNYYHEG